MLSFNQNSQRKGKYKGNNNFVTTYLSKIVTKYELIGSNYLDFFHGHIVSTIWVISITSV